MQRLRAPADLVAASGGDPLVRHLVPHLSAGAPIMASEGAVLFAYDYWDGTGAQVVGEPVAAAKLALSAAWELPTDYCAVPEGAVGLLGDAFSPDTPWCFRWTDQRPAAPHLPAGWLSDSEYQEVEALLTVSFSTASARPGSRHARRWAGIRDADGRLIAAAADCTESEVGFMASVVSDLRLRRTGVGVAMTSWMTHALLDDYGIAALWQYSDNIAATALYDKLGYRDEHRYVGGILRTN